MPDGLKCGDGATNGRLVWHPCRAPGGALRNAYTEHWSAATETSTMRGSPPPMHLLPLHTMNQPDLIILMGPAACGKSTVGQLLARRIGWQFRDGDDYHSADSIRRMRAGEALTDSDREPWLAALRALLADERAAGRRTVLACSALRQHYRQALYPAGLEPGQLKFVYLDVRPEVLALRLVQRTGHFLTGNLLESQLATLEKPAAEDDVLWLDGEDEPDTLVATICLRLGV